MTAIASGSSAVVTVTSNQQIAINSAPGVRAYVEATSGVPGSASKMKLANHPGGFGTYGPFGAGTVTIYAVGGDVDYDATDPLRSADSTDVTPAEIYAAVSGDVIVNSRNGLGQATSYTQGGVTYTVTYGNFGPATVSGGGTVTTYNYSAAGQLTSVTTA